jgi:hypothetical protein
MFLIGAAGDQAPRKKSKTVEADLLGNFQERDLQESGYDLIQELGGILGKETIALSKEVKRINPDSIITGKKEFLCPGQKIPEDIHMIHPTFHYDFTKDEDRTVLVEAIAIGDMVILGTRPELNAKTARELKNMSPFSNTIVMTMVNGGAKYMADQESYDKITYESMNSLFGKGSAEILTENATVLLEQMIKLR